MIELVGTSLVVIGALLALSRVDIKKAGIILLVIGLLIISIKILF